MYERYQCDRQLPGLKNLVALVAGDLAVSKGVVNPDAIGPSPQLM